MPSRLALIRSARSLAFKFANKSGVSGAIASSRWRQQRLLVLCYHGISQDDEHEWGQTLYISPERLEQRLEQLRKLKAAVLPLDQAVDALYAGDLPPLAVSLTFDDGACDFSLKAVPILAAAQMHSTLYLTTYYTRKDMPVFMPFVSYVLWKGRGRTVLLPGINIRATIPADREQPEFLRIHKALLDYAAAAGMNADEKNDFARQISIATGADFDDLCQRRVLHLMNPAEVRALDPKLVSIQMHTHRHRTPASMDELRDELDRNAAEIVNLSGRSDVAHHFCYPSGVYSSEFVGWLREYGVKSATTCVRHYSTPSTSRLEIPRFLDTMADSADTFEAWVSGSAALALALRNEQVAEQVRTPLGFLCSTSFFGY
ncbi:MAG: polysaccharide deacetylase family protein [Gemmatimonadaceae bacterium]